MFIPSPRISAAYNPRADSRGNSSAEPPMLSKGNGWSGKRSSRQTSQLHEGPASAMQCSLKADGATVPLPFALKACDDDGAFLALRPRW